MIGVRVGGRRGSVIRRWALCGIYFPSPPESPHWTRNTFMGEWSLGRGLGTFQQDVGDGLLDFRGRRYTGWRWHMMQCIKMEDFDPCKIQNQREMHLLFPPYPLTLLDLLLLGTIHHVGDLGGEYQNPTLKFIALQNHMTNFGTISEADPAFHFVIRIYSLHSILLWFRFKRIRRLWFRDFNSLSLSQRIVGFGIW